MTIYKVCEMNYYMDEYRIHKHFKKKIDAEAYLFMLVKQTLSTDKDLFLMDRNCDWSYRVIIYSNGPDKEPDPVKAYSIGSIEVY